MTQEVRDKYGSIYYPDDFWLGVENHPQCCFFEAFQGTLDPFDNYFCLPACHMMGLLGTKNQAEICKGDYLECPLMGNVTWDSTKNNNEIK